MVLVVCCTQPPGNITSRLHKRGAPFQTVLAAYCCLLGCFAKHQLAHSITTIAFPVKLCGHCAAACRYDRTSGTRYGRASNISINLLMCVATFLNGLYGMTAVSRLVRPVYATEINRG